jgi:hypothetical protein
MSLGYTKEAMYQLSDLYLHGKWSNSWRNLRGCWRFLRGVLVVFDISDVPWIHQGSYLSMFRFLPSWEMVKLLGELDTKRDGRRMGGLFTDGMQLYIYRWCFLPLDRFPHVDG